MRVIGTAGHVDHGKSTLVQALTGMHPDRLKAEKAREMTIELGFAWFRLPNGREVGIVDVPGHRDFIENMLSGVGGIDAALLVIAADEGVMPQTREHLAILDLLQIRTGLVVMTKIDLVDDPEWLDLVHLDIEAVLEGTRFENFPLVRVSSFTGEGIPELIDKLSEILENSESRVDYGRARLPVDRVFTISGFGTIVTGTLVDGVFRVGDEVEILPGQRKARIRGLQNHKAKTDHSEPGSRTAINLSGIEVDQLNRGDVVCAIGKYKPTQRIDAHIRLLTDIKNPLRHNQEVKLFIGSTEVIARVRVLGSDQIDPGGQGWIQLETSQPIVALRTDRFILRRPSPGETIGGGEVINPFPGKRHKRFDANIINQLEAYAGGNPDEILLQASSELGIATFDAIYKKGRIASSLANQFLKGFVEKGLLINLEDSNLEEADYALFASKNWYEGMLDKSISILRQYHQQYPLRPGIPREELKSRLKLPQKQFALLIALWEKEKRFTVDRSFYALIDFKVNFRTNERVKVNQLLAQFEANPYSPPSIKESLQVVDVEIFNALIDQEQLIAVNNDVVFLKSTYDQMVQEVLDRLKREGQITVAQFRDMYQTSRKYALSFLEQLDAQGLTERVGDARQLRQMR